MLEVFREAMVLEDDGVKDVLEHLVGVLVAHVDAAVLVIELDGTGNSLKKSVECKRSSDKPMSDQPLLPFTVILGLKNVLTSCEKITTNKDRWFRY